MDLDKINETIEREWIAADAEIFNRIRQTENSALINLYLSQMETLRNFRDRLYEEFS
ncbi:hypothetical protein [Bowdeniella massiliensis]|uniref:hypothetical protein n=1 Tax=Bowdeniella massiliensis TaxID=2932264 RepID=UPI0020278E27|nr:hypothetical protein [Bowdeniella massiliensis]